MSKPTASRLSTWAGLLFVLAVSYFLYKNWQLIHEENLQALIGVSYDVLDGTPHWRAFQNRIFSPIVVWALGWVSDKPFVLFVQAGFFALNLALYAMVCELTGSVLRAMLAVLAATLTFIFQHHFWFYTWDLTEAGLLLLFSYAVLRDRMGIWVGLLAIVALFNKETSVLIGVFLMARSLAGQWLGQGFDRKRFMQGAAFSVLAVITAEVLRHALFKTSSLDGVGGDQVHAAFGNHFNQGHNWEVLLKFLQRPSAFFLLIVFYLTALGGLVTHAFRRRDPALIALSISLLGYAASLWIFGVLDEYRIYQPLMWCMALLIACLSTPRLASSAPAQAG